MLLFVFVFFWQNSAEWKSMNDFKRGPYLGFISKKFGKIEHIELTWAIWRLLFTDFDRKSRIGIQQSILKISLSIFQLLGHCIAAWYAMSQSLVKLTEMGTSWGPV